MKKKMLLNIMRILIFQKNFFHYDFEKGISNAMENIFPNINIKYCIWHYKKLLMKKK